MVSKTLWYRKLIGGIDIMIRIILLFILPLRCHSRLLLFYLSNSWPCQVGTGNLVHHLTHWRKIVWSSPCRDWPPATSTRREEYRQGTRIVLGGSRMKGETAMDPQRPCTILRVPGSCYEDRVCRGRVLLCTAPDLPILGVRKG